MLKTNSKKACENIREYIMQDADYLSECAEYDGVKLNEKRDFLAYAWRLFTEQKSRDIERNYGNTNFGIFLDWARGLALGSLFCYYYNRSAVDDLGAILEETEEEKAKHTEEQAEEMLSRLIYRELDKAAHPAYARHIFKEV